MPNTAGRVTPEKETEQIGRYEAGKRGSRHRWSGLPVINFHHFTTTPPLLALPFVASVLLLQTIVLRARILPLLPPSSSFLERQISQNIAISVLAFPSTISSFLLSKASVIHHLLVQENPESRSFARVLRIYTHLVHTHICNSILTLSAKAISFYLVHWAHGFFAAAVSCLILGYTFIISNTALIVSGVEGSAGFTQTLKACALIKGNEGAALWLTVWTNSALAAVEFLFQCRVVQANRDQEGTAGILSAALEGIFIAYLYAVLLVVDTIQAFYQFVPASVRYYFYKLFMRWFGEISKPQPDIFSLIIPEKNDMNRNEVFAACQIYLCSKMNDSADCLEVSKATNEDTMSYKLVTGVTFFDTFEGVGLNWTLNSTSSNEDDGGDSSDHNKVQKRPSHSPVIGNMYFSLSFDKKHKKKICDSYLPFVISTSQDITREGRVLRIYDCASVYGYGSRHSSVKMTHPFTFEKLAIDPEMKKMIMDDLDRFVKRRDFYKRVGKPWKRGYLLYGPPGTGKSSLIAAMANHLRFDIYDVQLGSMLGRYYALRDL
ncbi:unnamed protein product [Cuscuta campestris]|uniref:AAA+ ATPase domain-containing protein n=1 Tax=Cuscuta campestris TaxID=132261 RepID=A0A484NJJ7_9ASTE|nr:unnamed protein product [Cuscuta campestris]